MPLQKYSDFLEISPTFESVVDIDADKRNTNLWREYIVGGDMEKLLEEMCQSLNNESPDARRSFWIHGSYGTGKSYAAIFVKHLMEEKPEVIQEFMGKSARLSHYKNRVMKFRNKGDYLVVWKTGCTGIRTGDMLLLEAEKAVRDALIKKYGDKAYLGSSSLISAVKENLADQGNNWDYIVENSILSDDYGSADELRAAVNRGDMTAIKDTAAVIRQRGIGLINNLETYKAWIADVIEGNGLSKSGIFFIWDEFTEYVTHSDDRTVMQQLSEFCKEKPFFMFFVVHRSQDMLDSMGKDNYQLITHRFHEVEFHVDANASFDLIAGSVMIRIGMAENWKDARRTVVQNIKPFLPDMSGLDDKISEMIDSLCPIHPMTVKLLSRVAENFAAAQRTMFRFMKDQSNPEQGFIGYINKWGPDDQACWLTPDWLWDYFFTRESDFSDKDAKAAEYIQHYEENRHLVESDENAHRIFKTAMLLLAVMSTTKGVYGGKKAQGGISATVDCLQTCLAGVMTSDQVKDLLETLKENKVLMLDEAANGIVRLQLPFNSNSAGDFAARFDTNDKKYTRYQMFTKDGDFAKAFEAQAWDEENDVMAKRMKIAVCCAETNSIKIRLDEIQKELDKAPYRLGLLIVTVRDKNQYLAVQADLESRAQQSNEPRLIIALVETPLTDEMRKKWLTSITNMEMAKASGQTASGNQYNIEANMVISTWVSSAISGSKIIAWNRTQVFKNQFGMAQLRMTIRTNVLQTLFKYAPENIVVTTTAFKPCNDPAPLAGITRTAATSQLKSVLNGLQISGLLNLGTISEMVNATGSKAADAVSKLADVVKDKMESGAKVVLSDLWSDLQKPPFGYYDTIACGVILGYVFSCYKDSKYSWTDNAQGTHVLGETTLKTMVLRTVKGQMTTDYLSAGSITFQKFSDYAQKIFSLTAVQTATETECWHNVREVITKSGAPFWVLKYLPDDKYGSADNKDAAMKIIDNIQEFVTRDNEREGAMSNVIQLFSGRGKLRVNLQKAFADKAIMAAAFRTFLFGASPELQNIATRLSVKPEDLSDKVHTVMQAAIYTWTEDKVKAQLEGIVGEYNYLEAINKSLGKVYHSIEDAQKDLRNLIKHARISKTAIERLGKPWYAALDVLDKVAANGIMHLSAQERQSDIDSLLKYGAAAMNFLSNGKTVLNDILENDNLECTTDELSLIYEGLKDLSFNSSFGQFEKELNNQKGRISQARHRILLQERWLALTGEQTVRSWCTTHCVPIMWVVSKNFQAAIATVISVQNNKYALDSNVQNAIAVLESPEAAILNDDQKLENAFLAAVGQEYKEIFTEKRSEIIARAKMQIGNDMSDWTASNLIMLQQIMKKARQEKAKKEKLENAKNIVKSMKEDAVKDRLTVFLDEHPEFCDFFMK